MYDTSPEIEKRVAMMMRQKTPAQRLRMVGSMFASSRKMIKAGLEMENGGPLPEAELRAKTFLRMYGDCFSNDEIKKIMEKIPNMKYE
jgi:hypothetical protein